MGDETLDEGFTLATLTKGRNHCFLRAAGGHSAIDKGVAVLMFATDGRRAVPGNQLNGSDNDGNALRLEGDVEMINSSDRAHLIPDGTCIKGLWKV